MEMLNKVIYLAGPYRAENTWEVLQNIRRAERYALEFWRRGVPVLCPHKNTALYDGAAPDSVWLDGDLIMLVRCDALVLLPGWENSSGTKTEKGRAETAKMPVYEIDPCFTIEDEVDRIVSALGFDRSKTCGCPHCVGLPGNRPGDDECSQYDCWKESNGIKTGCPLLAELRR